jgi:hypothetical protein
MRQTELQTKCSASAARVQRALARARPTGNAGSGLFVREPRAFTRAHHQIGQRTRRSILRDRKLYALKKRWGGIADDVEPEGC